MDRRYDQPSRDRYISRPRFEDRREERYYRRDDGLDRPWPHSRYPSSPPSSRRQHYDGPPKIHHSQERHRHLDRRQLPRKEADRAPSSRRTEEKRSSFASQDSKAKNGERPESRSKEMPTKEVITKKESTTTVAVAQDKSTTAVAMTQDESVKVDTQSEDVTTSKVTKARVYKEAVVSFDSDGEDQLMQADWGYDSDDESVVVDLQHNTASKNEEEEKAQAEEPLPASWVVHLSDKGEKYYYNKVTRETVWDKPTADTITTTPTTQQENDDKQGTVKDTPRQDDNSSKIQNNSSSSNTKNGSNSNGDSNRKDKNSTSDIDRTKKENDIGRHSSSYICSKRKHSPSSREETRLPPSLASRISYPKSSNSTSEAVLHHQPSRWSERDRPLPPQQQPRVHHLNHHHHEYQSSSRYSPPPPPSDRYYRSNAPPPLPPHSNGREVWIDHHRHHPYRHHPMDYAPLPPPPPRWISGRRIDYDRREPLPYIRRSSRDYR